MRLAVGEGPGNEIGCRGGVLRTRLRCGRLKPLCDSICVGYDLFIHRPPLSRATSMSLSSNQQNRRYERLSVCSWNGLVTKHFHLENYWYINCTTVYGLQVQEGHVWEDMKSSASTLATKVG